MRDDRHTHRVHTWPILMALALCPLSCQTLTHKEARIQAEQRWSTVRGQVKTQLARQQYKGRLFEEAAATLIESLSLDPKQPDAYVLLARANLELGRVASAREVVDRAHRAELDSPELVYTEGVILEQCEDIDGALEQYRRAWALDPKNMDYLVAVAESLVAVGRSSQALAMLKSNADKLDDDGTLRVLAASIATLHGDADLAIRQLRRAMTSSDAADAIADELGVLLARNARCDEALAILRPILQLSGEVEVRGAVRRAVATCYLETDAVEQAKQTLQAYTLEHPEDTAAQLLLAKAAVGTGDIATALAAIDAAEARKPNHPEVKLVRAVVQWRTDDLDAASSTLRELLTLVPDDVDAHCLLGEISLAQSQPDKAHAEFRRALEIDPACRWATSALKSLEEAAAGS